MSLTHIGLRDRYRQLAREGNNQEFIQARIRIGLNLLFTIYIISAFLLRPKLPLWEKELSIILCLAHMGHTAAMMISVLANPAPSPVRKVCGMLGDFIVSGIGLAVPGTLGAPLYAMVMWITAGYGIRFGKPYLYLGIALTALCLAAAWQFNDYWDDHPSMAVSMTIAALVVPLYIRVLVYRYDNAVSEAAQASQAKSRFIAQMSHEFRTPLNGILGTTHTFMGSSMPRKHLQSIEVIRTSAQSLLHMVEDILEVSAIEAGKDRRFEITFNLQATLEQLEHVLATQALMKGIGLSCRCEPDVPKVIHGDHQHLNQILMNLIHNGIKFTETGGVSVRVSLAQETVTGCVLRFEVSDTGIGIPDDFKPRIFQAFEQVDIGQHKFFSGIGMGTTIAKTLVEGMGGWLTVADNPGGGSVFCFEVPYAKVSEEEAEAFTRKRATTDIDEVMAQHRSRVRTANILVVDDQVTNQYVMRLILEKAGHELAFASNGLEAVAHLETHQPDLITLDLHMPGMDGLQVLRHIQVRDREQGRQTPVVLITADATRETMQVLADAGATAIMTKPVEPMGLLSVLEVALQTHDPGAIEPPPFVQRGHALADVAEIDNSLEFLEEFTTQAWKDIDAAMDDLVQAEPSPELMRAKLHAIRGVSRSISADALGEACQHWMGLSDGLLMLQHPAIMSRLLSLAHDEKPKIAALVQQLGHPVPVQAGIDFPPPAA